MLNLNSIMIGTQKPKKLADFYEQVIGKKPDMQEGNWSGWQVGNCFLNIGEHSEVPEAQAKEPQRIIINFETKEVKEEFDRIKDIDGVSIVKEPYQMDDWSGWIATLADPDGNYFQLMTPWDQDESKAN